MISIRRTCVCLLAALLVLSVSANGEAQQQVALATPDQLLAVEGKGRPPIFVFIPGILGSKLTDTKTGAVLWGEKNFDSPGLMLKDADEATASILEHYSVEFLWRDYGYAVYSSGLRELDNHLTGVPRLLTFAYDWRRSNEDSAVKLQDWLCANAATLRDRPVFFVAHSMGGLVLKHWLKNHYIAGATCASDGNAMTPKIGAIAFIGTPHFGAPGTFSALLGEYELLGMELANSVVVSGLNAYGASFDSLYELLPAQNALDDDGNPCFDLDRHKLAFAVVAQPGVGEPEPVNLFSVEAWRRLGLPERVPGGDLATFYMDVLPKKLERARRIVCEMAQFEMPEDLRKRTIYMYGVLNENEVELQSTKTKYVLSTADALTTNSFEVRDIRLPSNLVTFPKKVAATALFPRP